MPPKSLADADAANGLLRLNFGYPDQDAYAGIVDVLVDDRVPKRLAAADRTLWGDRPVTHADVSWTAAPSDSRAFVEPVVQLRQSLADEGLDRIVLIADGGTAPGARVVAGDAPMIVLDGFDADGVSTVLDGPLDRTVLVVAAPSGSSEFVDTVLDVFAGAFERADLDFADRVVAVTPSGTDFDQRAVRDGFRSVFDAAGAGSGTYTALQAFSLVPAGLAGADISAVLDDAGAVENDLQADSAENPALRLGALLGMAHWRNTDKVALTDSGSGVGALSAWVSALIAESTGKSGVGLLPIEVADADSPGFSDAGADATLAFLGEPLDALQPTSGLGVSVYGPAGASVLVWQYAMAVMARIAEIDPFSAPEVEMSAGQDPQLLVEDGPAVVYGDARRFHGIRTVAQALDLLLHRVPEYGYVGLLSYLGPDFDDDIRAAFASTTGIQTALARGNGMVDALTGYYVAGRDNGAILVLTADRGDSGDSAVDSLGTYQHALARGIVSVLAERDRPVLHVDLADRSSAVRSFFEVIHQQLGREVR